MIRKFLILLCTTLISFSFIIIGSADTYSVYTSTLPTSSYGQSLYSIYASSDYYDPQLHWVLWSSSNNTWYLAVETDNDQFTISSTGIQSSYTCRLFRLEYVSASYGTPSYYETSQTNISNLNLNFNGYLVLGNFNSTIEPEYADSHDYRFIVVPLLILISFAILFYVFKIRFDKERSFRL